MTNYCPSCGHNLAADRPLVAGRFSYSDRDGFAVDGERVAMRPACHRLIGALMAARGRIVSRSTLGEREYEDAVSPSRLIGVYAALTRSALRALRIEPPFVTVRAVGLKWAGPPVKLAG